MNPAITVNHSEFKSVWSVVDKDAPEADQPCVLAEFDNRAEAERFAHQALIFGAEHGRQV